MQFKKYPERFIWHVVSAPFIYGMIVPFIFLDMCLELYHRVTFACYALPYIERGKYIKVDRHKLKYLSYTEKLNCAYCGYSNGLINYAKAIAGETEKYWCAIKHQPSEGFVEPMHHENFLAYGDEVAYQELKTRDTGELSPLD